MKPNSNFPYTFPFFESQANGLIFALVSWISLQARKYIPLNTLGRAWKRRAVIHIIGYTTKIIDTLEIASNGN